MKTVEFGKRLNRQGCVWTKSTVYGSPLLDIYENDLQMKDGRPFATINENQRYDMGINPNNYSDELPESTFFLICDYAATPIDKRRELEKKYFVKVFKAENFYYWKISTNDAVDLTVSTNTNSFSSDKQFTMDEIKKYGLEGCKRVEVQDETK